MRTPTAHGHRGERGAAIVWTVFLTTVLATAGALALVLGAVVVTRQRAASVADLAALAAAQSADDPCAEARFVVEQNAAALVACAIAAGDVVVTVAVDLPGAAGRVLASLGGTSPGAIRATARAGQPGE